MSSLTIYSGAVFTLLVILQYCGETHGVAWPCEDDNCGGHSGHYSGHGKGHVIGPGRGHGLGYWQGHSHQSSYPQYWNVDGADRGYTYDYRPRYTFDYYQGGQGYPYYQYYIQQAQPNILVAENTDISESQIDSIHGHGNTMKELIDLNANLDIPISIFGDLHHDNDHDHDHDHHHHHDHDDDIKSWFSG